MYVLYVGSEGDRKLFRFLRFPVPAPFCPCMETLETRTLCSQGLEMSLPSPACQHRLQGGDSAGLSSSREGTCIQHWALQLWETET